jgi:PAS domain-containing protein
MADRTSPEPSEDLRELSAVFDELAAERAAAQAELERLRRRDELILNSAMEGICGLDRAGRITFANRAAGDLLGYAPSELAGQENPSAVFALKRPRSGRVRDRERDGGVFFCRDPRPASGESSEHDRERGSNEALFGEPTLPNSPTDLEMWIPTEPVSSTWT